MADTKVTGLTENTTPALTDLLYIVDDPGGTPASQKLTLTSLKALLAVTPGARVYSNAAAQVMTSGSDLVIAFNQERYDNDAIHDNSTNNTRLTCKTAGKYLIVGQVDIESGGNATYQSVTIRLNGTTSIGYTHNYSSSTEGAGLNVVTVYDLAVNDYVELVAKQSSGSNRNCNVNANRSPEFMMQRIG